MERITKYSGGVAVIPHDRIKDAAARLAAYESTGLTPEEVETLEYLRKRYEDESYDFCGEFGTNECQFKTINLKFSGGKQYGIFVYF